MSRGIVYASVVTLLACRAFGQAPAFDAVSIKPNISGSGNSSSNTHQGVLTATNVSLKSLIMRAYEMLDYQISGPEWLSGEKFDVAAKPPAGAKEDQLPLMLQAMLAERFKLAVHHDSKVFPVYGLVIGKGGPKFKEVKDEGGHNMTSGRGNFVGERCSMAALAAFLARQMDRPVVDMTDVKGVFDVKLNWTPEDAEASHEEGKADKDAYPPLLTALQEQLGLKVEPRRAPLGILVIDHAEKVPTEN